MKHRHLGASPLKISPLCLGTMMFADQTELGTAREIVAHARAHGVNFIDTADVYSFGKSESMVGALLKGQRDDWIVATKLGNRMSERPEMGYSRRWVQRACDASLQRLAIDSIDIYYLHRDFNDMRWTSRCVRSTTCCVRADPLLGPEQLSRLAHRRGGAHRAAINMPAPVVCQPYYNLLNRQPEVEVLPAVRTTAWVWCRTADRARRAVGQVRAGPSRPKAHAPGAATSG
jgi:aryl-alcohol dehydrogenase-like predicted oxidoreductase